MLCRNGFISVFITFAFLMLGISKGEGEDFEDFMLEIFIDVSSFSNRMQNRKRTQNVYVVIRIIVVTFSHVVCCLNLILRVLVTFIESCDYDNLK